MIDNSINDAISKGNAGVSFDSIGDKIRGQIVGAKLVPQKDFATGEVKRFDTGEEMNQFLFTLLVDGEKRDLYAKGQMRSAIREAVAGSPKGKIEEFAWLEVEYIEDEPAKKRGYNPKKIYRVTYEPPSAIDADGLI